MYEAFSDYRHKQMSEQEREELYQKLLSEKSSVFASHPSFAERIEAIANLPAATRKDTTMALTLFESPEEIEKELTEFLTGYMAYIQQLQQQAAMEA
jgi:hypothetical protein